MLNKVDPNEWLRCIGKTLRKSDMTIAGTVVDVVEEWDCAYANFKWWLILDNGKRVFANKVSRIGELSVTLGVGL